MRIQRSLSVSGRLGKRVVAGLCVAAGITAIWAGVKSVQGKRGVDGLRAVLRSSRGANASSAKGVARNSAPAIPGSKSALPVALTKSYGNLPLSFEPNFGQTDNRVKYLSRGNGYEMFLTPTEALFELETPEPGSQGGKARRNEAWSPNGRRAAIVRMKLVGSNPSPVMAGLDELPGKSNYFIGRDSKNWRTNVSQYRRVAEREVYPGIDLVYYGNQRQLEYDFVLKAGANPGAIRLRVEGAKRIAGDSTGDLKVQLEGGDLWLHKPVVYQKANGNVEPVEGGYVLKGKNEVAFQVGKYDASRDLVIDPILAYSTYVGGSNIDSANGIAVATDGTAFVVGGTFSSDFPVAHPLQPSAGGPRDFPQDAFVSKLSADGSTLLYSTYLGGSEEDTGSGIAVDTFGSARGLWRRQRSGWRCRRCGSPRRSRC